MKKHIGQIIRIHGFDPAIKLPPRYDIGKRLREVEQASDGSLWLVEDANPGALIHVTPT